MKTFADRLKYAMQIRNKKQSDLARETNIDKSKLSNYVNGKYQPKQDGYYLLAKALRVSIEWLMGKDVPMEIKEESTRYPNGIIAYGGSSNPQNINNDDTITFDDFTYAMYNETKDLNEDQKAALLQMAKMLNKSK